jgi:hypothetical protein
VPPSGLTDGDASAGPAPELAGADGVLLPETTADAIAGIASALEMGYFYCPAIHHGRAGQDFGSAVLSRWPIEHDEKLVLPLQDGARFAAVVVGGGERSRRRLGPQPAALAAGAATLAGARS